LGDRAHASNSVPAIGKIDLIASARGLENRQSHPVQDAGMTVGQTARRLRHESTVTYNPGMFREAIDFPSSFLFKMQMLFLF
jgi:hypothetical protein